MGSITKFCENNNYNSHLTTQSLFLWLRINGPSILLLSSTNFWQIFTGSSLSTNWKTDGFDVGVIFFQPLEVPIHTGPGPVDPETLTLSHILGLERVLFVSSPSRLSANTPFEPSAKRPAGRKSPERIILSSISHPEAGHLQPHSQMVWPGGEHRHNRLTSSSSHMYQILVTRYSLHY